mmetsp:Transcript_23368/g.47399  ORF Transcript_23368/g.47399 Transcript_23368/m.47399 type:complete len:81 (+) Transcript_23368:197-439(+)
MVEEEVDKRATKGTMRKGDLMQEIQIVTSQLLPWLMEIETEVVLPLLGRPYLMVKKEPTLILELVSRRKKRDWHRDNRGG